MYHASLNCWYPYLCLTYAECFQCTTPASWYPFMVEMVFIFCFIFGPFLESAVFKKSKLCQKYIPYKR